MNRVYCIGRSLTVIFSDTSQNGYPQLDFISVAYHGVFEWWSLISFSVFQFCSWVGLMRNIDIRAKHFVVRLEILVLDILLQKGFLV
jgi:hypothetical protein